MKYRYSAIDNNNLKWMSRDNSCATLSAIHLKEGKLRGLAPFRIDIAYPISAIAGENGSGKSTFLAMAACAYHNKKSGYKLGERKATYYTFSDFFVQSNNEVPPSGIKIRYLIRHDNWIRGGKKVDSGPGWQTRSKKDGGKWNNYDSRVNRNVVYFGIQRVVPHYERSAHKSYRSRFKKSSLGQEIRERIRDIASKIIGKTYTEFEIHKHSKYSLPVTSYNGVRYSGFNMGAGESAVFEILTALFEAGRGTLLVIDEIELGLHEKAQRRLIEELKLLCKEFHCQIICSTHSHVILDTLPPEARFFVEVLSGNTVITPGISPDLACGKLSGRNSHEIDFFVEDGAAKSILEIGLPLTLRERIKVTPIGSSEAVLRQLSSRYLEGQDNCLAILDGDKRGEHTTALRRVRENVETRYRESEEEINQWCENRIHYLPGNTWPEKCLIEITMAQEDKQYLLEQWGLENVERINRDLENALLAGKHNEFYALHENVQQSVDQVRADVVRFVNRTQPDFLSGIIEKITRILEANV